MELLLMIHRKLYNMAKLYAELTKHDKGRIVKQSDNTRIMLEARHKNKTYGTFEMYHVDGNDTVNILWRPHGKGFGSEIHLITESKHS